MIIGVGTDLVEINKIRSIVQRQDLTINKTFTPEEINYCSKKNNPDQHYAARFAAKEAVFKAMGTGWSSRANWLDVCIKNNSAGCPEIQLVGTTKDFVDKLGVRKIHISLTHTGNYAGAFVVLES